MAQARKILVADADPETVRLLAPPLRQRGYHVHHAHDGSRALQVAILRFPDLILLDDRTPLLDPKSFVRILRTNPRTERIPVVLLGTSPDPERVRAGTYLQKPLQVDEVLARVEQLFMRADAARAAGESRDLEGDLSHIPLPDLLQVLAGNHRTGRLTLDRGEERAEISIREGRVVDAVLGPAVAEKALWRLLTRQEGSFAFRSGIASGLERIDRRLDELLLEGMRQHDELTALRPGMPGPGDQLELAVDPAELPPGLHPVTREVAAALAGPLPFAALLDRCTASDLEVCRALIAMLEHGLVRRHQAAPAPAAAPFLAAPQLHALRARVARGRSSGPRTIGKVVVAGGDPAARRAARQRLAALPGFTPLGLGPEQPFGTLGRLELGDGLRIDLVELPVDAGARPLWRPFAAGAVGALVLLPADDAAPLLAELSRELRLPLVATGPGAEGVPAALADAPGGLSYEGNDAGEALRALLNGAARRRAGY